MLHSYNPDLPVFILGGGPSLRGFDGYQLSRRQTLAIHHSHRLIPWTDVMLAKDGAFCASHRDAQGTHWWKVKRTGHIVTTNPKAPAGRAVYVDPADLDIVSGRKRTYVTTRCAGAQALGLALHLGARKLVLLGFDGVPGHWSEGEPFAARTAPDEAACAEFAEDMARIARLGLDITHATLPGASGPAPAHFPSADLSAFL